VYTPTLTGIGERSHLLTPAIDLDLHTQDIVNVFKYEDLQEVVLVGHSYGGMVIASVSERIPERLAHVVYLDAFVPFDGEALLDLGTPERTAWLRQQVAAVGDGWLIPCPPLDSFGLSEADAAWLGPLVGSQPLKTFEQPVQLSSPAAQALAHTFIRCVEYPGFKSQAERAQAAPGWRYCEIPTSHIAMATMPERLAELLLEVAAPVNTSA
jgi:pimeloyl-ACP methyl ester carboxylesterase